MLTNLLATLSPRKSCSDEFCEQVVDACIRCNIPHWQRFLRDRKIIVPNHNKPLEATKTEIKVDEDDNAMKVNVPVEGEQLSSLKTEFVVFFLRRLIRGWLESSMEIKVTSNDVGLTIDQLTERNKQIITNTIKENIGE